MSGMAKLFRSLKVLQSKNLLNLLIIRILLSNPMWIFRCDLIPRPISQVRVEKDTGVEPVTTFDHLSGLSVVQVHAFEDVVDGEVVVDQVVIGIPRSLVDYLLVHFRQVASQCGCVLAGCCVGAEPACTGTDFQAVEEVVDLVVGHIQGMDGALQVLVEQVAVGKSEDHHVTSLRQLGVKPVQQPSDVLLEICRVSASYAATTNIIADELDEKQHGVVGGL